MRLSCTCVVFISPASSDLADSLSIFRYSDTLTCSCYQSINFVAVLRDNLGYEKEHKLKCRLRFFTTVAGDENAQRSFIFLCYNSKWLTRLFFFFGSVVFSFRRNAIQEENDGSGLLAIACKFCLAFLEEKLPLREMSKPLGLFSSSWLSFTFANLLSSMNFIACETTHFARIGSGFSRKDEKEVLRTLIHLEGFSIQPKLPPHISFVISLALYRETPPLSSSQWTVYPTAMYLKCTCVR